MLLKVTPTFCQSVTSQNKNEFYGDTLVYTPKVLMELLMSDLEQCDLDRIELKKAKAELQILYIDYAKKENALTIMKRELSSLREYNDTLTSQNLALTIENTTKIKKLKRGKRLWASTTFLSIMSAIGIHLNWKNSYVTY